MKIRVLSGLVSVALAVLSSAVAAAPIAVVYTIDKKSFKKITADDTLTFSFYDDDQCTNLVSSGGVSAGAAGVSYSTSKLRTVKGGAKPPKGMRIDAVVDVDPVPAVAYVALTSSAAVVPVPAACQLQAAVGGGLLALANMSCGAGEAVVGFDAAGGVVCEPFNTFVRRGPVTNVNEADLGGWSQCYQHTFAGAPADNILTDVMTTCTGAEILLACRPVGDTEFDVVAHAPRADVVFDTTTEATTTHHANGTEWYFSGVASWGFAAGGDAVNKVPCDIVDTNPEKRICIHLQNGSVASFGGWRCGAALNVEDDTWEWVVFERD